MTLPYVKGGGFRGFPGGYQGFSPERPIPKLISRREFTQSSEKASETTVTCSAVCVVFSCAGDTDELHATAMKICQAVMSYALFSRANSVGESRQPRNIPGRAIPLPKPRTPISTSVTSGN